MSERPVRIGLMGDSIASGLGVRNKRYMDLVCARGGHELVDYSLTGSTLRQSWQRYLERPDAGLSTMIIAHGITEPIPRPTKHSLRHLPARWQRLGWMDPRPYYSSRLRRRLLERLESAIRWRVKNRLIAKSGYEVLEGLEDYLAVLDEVARTLTARGVNVVLLEPTSIDERYFPGASVKQLEYWAGALQVAGVRHVRTRPVLREWHDYLADHFHPNDAGHEKLAQLVLAEVR